MNRLSKNVDTKLCKKDYCWKETNHNAVDPSKRGHYVGTPFVYEECWLACYFCREEDKENGISRG